MNGFWTNESFHNYAMSKAFRSGLDRLRELGRVRRSVIMCAEAMWWRCHRRIIADYLLAAVFGGAVLNDHLIRSGQFDDDARRMMHEYRQRHYGSDM